MPQPIANFDSNVTWFGHGNGCLVCGRNYTNQGHEAGVQGVDLEVAVEMEGQLGLCYECAIEVGRIVGMERVDIAQQKVDYSLELLEEAKAREERSAADAAQARLDKDTVERLLGSVYTPEFAS